MNSAKNEKVMLEAKERFRLCSEWESATRVRFINDLKFGTADATNMQQWPDAISQSRSSQNKPCLTVNRVRVYCNEILGDAQQNKPDIEIRAVGGGSSFQSAQIFQGIIKHIEYISNAQSAYETASWNQVYGGIGYWRLTTDYADDESMNQEIFITRVQDSLSVYLDPNIQTADGSDARYGFVFRDLDRKQFETEYPKYKDLVHTSPLGSSTFDTYGWIDRDRVRIAEYYRKVDEDDTLHIMPDGASMKEGDVQDQDAVKAMRQYSITSRSITKTRVEYYLLAGSEVVEQNIWPGKYIPIIRLVGTETIIDRKLDRFGQVRCLLDSQRSLNYYTSAGIEFVALQTKTPFIAPVASIEGYEAQWASSNQENLAILPYNHLDDAGNPIPPPSRQDPPSYAPAYATGIQIAQSEMELASGQTPATMGEGGNERSAKAITERQRAGNNATYNFTNNQAAAIRLTGKMLLDLVPKVYDVARVMKIMAQDGTQQTIQVDPNSPQAHQPIPPADPEAVDPQHVSAIFNPSVGQYDCISDMGPDYATKRSEAFNALSQIITQNESLAPVIGDLWARSADFPLSDVIADRLKNMVPPQALGGPSPDVQQLQQHLAAQHQVMANMTTELQDAKNKASTQELQKELDWYKAETDRLKVAGGIDPAALMPIVRELVSQVLGQPVNNIIAQHVHENDQMLQNLVVPPQNMPQNQTNPQPQQGQ